MAELDFLDSFAGDWTLVDRYIDGKKARVQGEVMTISNISHEQHRLYYYDIDYAMDGTSRSYASRQFVVKLDVAAKNMLLMERCDNVSTPAKHWIMVDRSDKLVISTPLTNSKNLPSEPESRFEPKAGYSIQVWERVDK